MRKPPRAAAVAAAGGVAEGAGGGGYSPSGTQTETAMAEAARPLARARKVHRYSMSKQ